MDHQDLLERSVVMEHVVIKSVGSSANSHNHVVLLQSARKLVGSHQVHIVVLRVLDDWHGNVVVSDYGLDLLVKGIISSCLELDWGGLEELVALSIDLLIGEASSLQS